MTKFSMALLFVGVLAVMGCNSGKVQLGGTVTFTDGTPVPLGNVVFATSTYQASGTIESDGKYTMGSISQSDGLPTGKYKVYVAGADENVAGKNGETTRSLIDPKYASFASTPLECEIPAPKNTFDISVPKNPKK